jgi:hypothetical protein
MIGEASGHGDRELIEHKERVQVPQLRPAQTLNREAKDGKSTRNQELSCIIRGKSRSPKLLAHAPANGGALPLGLRLGEELLDDGPGLLEHYDGQSATSEAGEDADMTRTGATRQSGRRRRRRRSLLVVLVGWWCFLHWCDGEEAVVGSVAVDPGNRRGINWVGGGQVLPQPRGHHHHLGCLAGRRATAACEEGIGVRGLSAAQLVTTSGD